MSIPKKDVTDVFSLQKYLEESTEKSKRLYHYTSFESLLLILQSRSFRLSRMDLMNDRAEQKLSRQDQHLHNYIMSFTRDKEYVSMWAMYGRPTGLNIRIDISKELLKKSITNNFYYDGRLTNQIPLQSSSITGSFCKNEFSISDVVYLDKNTLELRHKEKTFPNIKADTNLIEEMAGFIKYDAWEFERETRLRALMINQNVAKNRYNAENNIPKYIFAGISDELLHDFHITFNPWISPAMKDEVRFGISRVAGFDIPCDNSSNDGEIDAL